MRNYTIKNSFGCSGLFFKKHNFTYTKDKPNTLVCNKCGILAISEEHENAKLLTFLLLMCTLYLFFK